MRCCTKDFAASGEWGRPERAPLEVEVRSRALAHLGLARFHALVAKHPNQALDQGLLPRGSMARLPVFGYRGCRFPLRTSGSYIGASLAVWHSLARKKRQADPDP